MKSLIFPSKHGGYPGFRSGKLTQVNDGTFLTLLNPSNELSEIVP
jgi:hypothetical protein